MRDNFKSTVKSVARIIRKNGQMTRREIAELVPVSVMTVGKAVDALLEIGIITETFSSVAGTGRKAGLLSLCGGCCVIIDVSSRNFTFEIADLYGKKITAISHRYSDSALLEENLYVFLDRVKTFCSEKIRDMNLIGAGMIVPGRYDSALDKVELSESMDFIGVNPAALLKEAIPGAPALVAESISMGAAWAAERFPQYKNVIYVKADLPLGAAIVINGEPLEGAVGGIGVPYNTDTDKIYEYMSYIDKARMISRAVAGYMTVFRPETVIIERSDGGIDDGMTETVASLLTSEFYIKRELCPRVLRFSAETSGKKNGILAKMFENWLDKTVK